MMNSNITLEQYIEIVEDTKSAVIYDMDSFDLFELHNPEKPVFSALGVKLCCRDDEDAPWVIGYDNYELFLRFNPNLMKYIREQSKYLLEDDESGKESAKDKLYWEVTKYTKVNSVMCRMYDAYFSLGCELLGVSWHCWLEPSQEKFVPNFRRFQRNPEEYIKMSDAQLFLYGSAEQLKFPLNVELPYQPGDILHIDARPFGKPFYAVYGAETDGNKDYFEWTFREYGYYKRNHPCLFISEDSNGLGFTELTDNLLADIFFPYVPLDRIKVVESCDNPLLMKARALLKEDPNTFHTWLALNNCENVEHLILDG